MSKEFLVKFEDDYGNSRTVYARADNEHEARSIAISKARNCYNHRNAFEDFDGSSTAISNVYRKSSRYDDEDSDFIEHPWK